MEFASSCKLKSPVYGGLFGSKYTKDEARNLLVLLSSVLSTSSPKMVAKVPNATPGLRSIRWKESTSFLTIPVQNWRKTLIGPSWVTCLSLNQSWGQESQYSDWPGLGHVFISRLGDGCGYQLCIKHMNNGREPQSIMGTFLLKEGGW